MRLAWLHLAPIRTAKCRRALALAWLFLLDPMRWLLSLPILRNIDGRCSLTQAALPVSDGCFRFRKRSENPTHIHTGSRPALSALSSKHATSASVTNRHALQMIIVRSQYPCPGHTGFVSSRASSCTSSTVCPVLEIGIFLL